jgi:hypothetical protein
MGREPYFINVNDAIARYITPPSVLLVVGSKSDYKVNTIALKRILRIKKNIRFLPMNTQQSSGHSSYVASVHESVAD